MNYVYTRHKSSSSSGEGVRYKEQATNNGWAGHWGIFYLFIFLYSVWQ